MSNPIVNVVLFGGYSGVAVRHYASFVEANGARVVAVVEPAYRPERPLAGAPEGVQVFASGDDVHQAVLARRLPAISLAIVCVPDRLHKEVTAQCLDRGWHVLCEKPLTYDVQDARDLYRLAAERGRWLGQALQRRFMTPQIAQLVREGAVGAVELATFTWLRSNGIPPARLATPGPLGGVLADLAVHGLSHLGEVVPIGQLAELTATLARPGRGTIETEALVLGRLGTGARIGLEVSYHRETLPKAGGSIPDVVRLMVRGATGMIVAELPTHHTAAEVAGLRRELRPVHGDPRPLEALRSTDQCHALLARHAVGAVRRGTPASPEEQARELSVIAAIEAAYRSDERGGTAVSLA